MRRRSNTVTIEGYFPECYGIAAFIAEFEFPRDHVIVDIGSFVGLSAICMAKTRKYKVITIDCHDGKLQKADKFYVDVENTYERLIENIRKTRLTHFIEPIRKRSEEVEWNGRPIALLLIDGDHTYEQVKLDFDKFSPFVVENGFIMFHDYHPKDEKLRPWYPGVVNFVNQEVLTRDDYETHIFQMLTSILVRKL